MADEDTKSKVDEVPAPADDLKPEETKEIKEPEEPKVEESPEEPEIEEESPEPEPEPKAEEPPSRRESLRIQQLIEKLKQQPQQNQAETPRATGLDYGTALDADPEVIKQLESDRQTAVDAARADGLKAAESIQFRTMLEIDAPKVETKYPQLDKESTDFNPAVANAINQWYLSTAGYNPENGSVQNANVRYGEFVEGIMELANEMAGEKTAKTSKNIAKQAATTGLRPDGSRSKGLDLTKAPHQMSDEELKAVIAQNLK